MNISISYNLFTIGNKTSLNIDDAKWTAEGPNLLFSSKSTANTNIWQFLLELLSTAEMDPIKSVYEVDTYWNII